MVDLHFVANTREKAPLISDQFLKRVTIWISALALLTLVLNFFGQWYSRHMQQGLHTADTNPVDIFIGPDHLSLPANVIRFPEQRVPGEMESLSLYLLWPSLEGFTEENRAAFNRISPDDRLIFLQISQSTMTLDMSGRLGPIYSRLFDGPAEPGPQGLALHRFKEGSGYGSEVMLSASGEDGEQHFAIRCLLPELSSNPNGTDCQRDIAVGDDLSVLYRYPFELLKNWKEIDAAVSQYISSHLVRESAAVGHPAKTGRISR